MPEVFITQHHHLVSSSQTTEAITQACLSTNDRSHVVLEIGPGRGEHIMHLLSDRPDTRIFAVEPYVHGAHIMVCQMAQEPHPEDLCARLKIATVPLQILLPMMKDIRFDKIYALFPDPWPKGKHHRRRVINHESIDVLSQMLKENGEFITASDDPSCIEHLIDVVDTCVRIEWINKEDCFVPCEIGLNTRYAQKAKEAGRQCVYIACRRRNGDGG